MSSIIFAITLIVSCRGDSNFNSKEQSFSLELIQSTGLDHIAVGTFNVWSVMASAAIWAYGESQNQFSNSIIPTNNKSEFLAGYEKLRKEIYNSDEETIDFANFVFLNKDFDILPGFRQTLTTNFGAIIHTFDFEDLVTTSRKANAVIENAARPFPNVFHPNDFINSSMIMASVMAFQGFWKQKFSISHTTLETFYDNNTNKETQVPMMHQKVKVPHLRIQEINANVTELPFGNDGKYSMLFINPDPGVNIKDTLENITLNAIVDKLQTDVKKFGLKEIDLTLPRFSITANTVLNKPLEDIGVSEVFHSDHSQFSGISDEGIYISSIEHYVDFTLVEGGVTFKTTTPGYSEYSLDPSTFEATEPFIFFILEKPTRTILLGGLYSKARYPYFIDTLL